MSNGALGLVQGVNSGLRTGLAIGQQRIDNRRQDQYDQENRDYRQWQMGRAENQDAMAKTLHELNTQRLTLGNDALTEEAKSRRAQQAYGMYQSLTYNPDGTPKDEVDYSDPRFAALVNEMDDLREMMAGRSLVDGSNPFNGMMPASALTGDPNDRRLVPLVNRKDGGVGPVTENATDNPDDPIDTIDPDEVRELIEGYFGKYGLGETQRNIGLQRDRAGHEYDDQRSLNLYRGKKAIDIEGAQSLAKLGGGKDKTPDLRALTDDQKSFFTEIDAEGYEVPNQDLYAAYVDFLGANPGITNHYQGIAAFRQALYERDQERKALTASDAQALENEQQRPGLKDEKDERPADQSRKIKELDARIRSLSRLYGRQDEVKALTAERERILKGEPKQESPPWWVRAGREIDAQGAR